MGLGAEQHCTYHPENPGIAYCTLCQAPICGECHGVDRRGFAICTSCIRGDQGEPIPWELPSPSNSLALANTVVLALRHPKSFFQHLPLRGSTLPALIFGLLMQTVGLVLAMIWAFLLNDKADQALLESFGSAIPLIYMRALVFVSLPVLAAAATVLQAACLHLAFRIAGARSPWSLDLRIACYASAAYLLHIVPPIGGIYIGQLLAIFWLVDLQANAAQHFYKMSPLRAALASCGAVLFFMGMFSIIGV